MTRADKERSESVKLKSVIRAQIQQSKNSSFKFMGHVSIIWFYDNCICRILGRWEMYLNQFRYIFMTVETVRVDFLDVAVQL